MCNLQKIPIKDTEKKKKKMHLGISFKYNINIYSLVLTRPHKVWVLRIFREMFSYSSTKI